MAPKQASNRTRAQHELQVGTKIVCEAFCRFCNHVSITFRICRGGRTDVSVLKSVVSNIATLIKVDTMTNTARMKIIVRLIVFARVLGVFDTAHIARPSMMILTIVAEIECACLMRPKV
jgi:hypothetical protein